MAQAQRHTRSTPQRGPSQTKKSPSIAWVATFRAKAEAHGITEATYTRVMTGLKPDMTGLKEIRNQPEFHEQLWQYLNRRVSDWRIVTGRKVAKEYAPLLERIEKDFGVSPSIMLGVWGIESTFGDPIVAKNHMKPVFRRSPRWPGASRAGAPIGKAN